MITENHAAVIELVNYDFKPPVTVVKELELRMVNDAGEYETLRTSRRFCTKGFGMRSDYAKDSESDINY